MDTNGLETLNPVNEFTLETTRLQTFDHRPRPRKRERSLLSNISSTHHLMAVSG
jgi:hypothetical protein